MRVDVQSDAHGGVSEHLGDDLRVDVLAEEKRRARVAEVVESDRPEPGGLQERLEGAIAEVRGIDKGPKPESASPARSTKSRTAS
jgi:hypothetical protein